MIAQWTWAPALVSSAAVVRVADSWMQVFEALAALAAQPGAGGRSPSDLAFVTLSQAEIDALERDDSIGSRAAVRDAP